ncbi:MAG: Arm DNA-binding domain-containing protein, partial [Rhodospirillales bacterium]|nr:Arm DNA-binding domain-containing protein [Rhodospirillales bacterium]
MPQIKFTDQAIARLKPAGTTVWYSDQMKEGLRLAVGQKSKTFYFSKRHPQAGKVLTIKIGRHPALSVSAARRRAEKLFSDIEQGNDPTAE